MHLLDIVRSRHAIVEPYDLKMERDVVQVVHEKWTSVPPTPWKSWIGGGSVVGPLHEIVPMPASLSSTRSWTSREEVAADFPMP
jgi:hypothetical protein